MSLTPNFTLLEFATRDKPGGPKRVPVNSQIATNLRELAENLEVLRKEIAAPIIIVSGWRDVPHNTRVKGAKNSQHLYGKAADIRVVGVTPGVVADTIHRLIDRGEMKEGGVGLYPHKGFVHYDIRGKNARWNG